MSVVVIVWNAESLDRTADPFRDLNRPSQVIFGNSAMSSSPP